MNEQKVTEQKTQEFEPLLGFQEIAKLTGLSVPFLNKAKREYGLPHFKLGGSVKFKPSEVFRWIEGRKKC